MLNIYIVKLLKFVILKLERFCYYFFDYVIKFDLEVIMFIKFIKKKNYVIVVIYMLNICIYCFIVIMYYVYFVVEYFNGCFKLVIFYFKCIIIIYVVYIVI